MRRQDRRQRLRDLVSVVWMITALGVLSLGGCLGKEQGGGAQGTLTPASPRMAAATGIPPDKALPSTAPNHGSGKSGAPQGAAAKPTPGPVLLTVWTTEAYSPARADAGGQVLSEQYEAFMTAHPGIRIRYVLKQARGRAAILPFLIATSEVAPSQLPDLVMLDTQDLEGAARAGLLQPLDGLLSPELARDLFPFAVSVGRFNAEWLGVQFDADLEHLLVDTRQVARVPATWADIFDLKAGYLFPAGGEDSLVNDAFLIQYLALGGRFTNPQGTLALDRERITEVLRYYQQGVENGAIPADILSYHTLDDCWQGYQEGKGSIAHILASRYRAQRDTLQDAAVAGIPTRDGPPATMTRGKALAVVARDALRQQAAAQFIEWLMAPEHLAQWAQATGRLPTRRSAFALLPQDAYHRFLRTALETSFAQPNLPQREQVFRILQRAVRDVVTGAASPEDAASRVVESLR